MSFTRRQFVAAVAACPVCAAAIGGARGEGAHHWTYEHPDSWGEGSAFKACGVGDQQSPIDLTNPIRASVEPPKISWPKGDFEVVNNGHTIQVNVAPGGTVTSQGRKYDLKQFHFHTPSEHALDGRRTPMEAHFVHMGEGGNAAVIGVFLEAGGKDASPVFSAVMAAAPKEEGKGKLAKPVYPAAFLPKSKRFFRYEGSLTTPPCSEVVEWNVFSAPVAVAPADIEAFKAIFPMNARPLQPVSRRFLLSN